MSSAPNVRRSTRVPIKVAIEVEGCTVPLRCEGVTVVVNLHGVVVNLHGARISTSLALAVGMKISIHVILTDKQPRVVSSTLIVRTPSAAALNLTNRATSGEFRYSLTTARRENIIKVQRLR